MDSGASPERRAPMAPVAVGVGLVVIGTAWFLDAVGLVELRWRLVLPAALVAVGVALLAGARRGASNGLVPVGIVLSVLVLLQAFTPGITPGAGIGDRTERPLTADDVEDGYGHGMGNLDIDLRDLDLAPSATDAVTVEASLGMGNLRVRLPADATVEVRARSLAGEVVIDGQRRDGVNVQATQTVGSGAPRLRLDLSVVFGEVEVSR
jgi:hypothetical protein